MAVIFLFVGQQKRRRLKNVVGANLGVLGRFSPPTARGEKRVNLKYLTCRVAPDENNPTILRCERQVAFIADNGGNINIMAHHDVRGDRWMVGDPRPESGVAPDHGSTYESPGG